jgi:hypothetical protein
MAIKCEPGCSCGKHVISAEHREKIRQRALEKDHSYKIGRKQSPETVAKRAAKNKISRLGKRSNDVPAAGWWNNGGYRMLTGQIHPLAKSGGVLEHRKVLYDLIGPGPHACHWASRYGCEETGLAWSDGARLVVDHLDGNRMNNHPDNLVPSCTRCNSSREQYEKIIKLTLESKVTS